MGRAARGTVIKEGGRWKARITMPDKTRRTVHLPLGLTEEQARAAAEEISNAARFTTAVVTERAADETTEEYADRYVTWKIGKGQVAAGDTRGRLRKWVLPVIGKVPIAAVGRADLEAVVRNLDAAVATGRLAAKTASNAWGDVTGMFKQACQSKHPTLKVRESDPTEKVLGPDAGIDKEKPILFADEAARLLACEAIPVARRRIYAFAIYIAARANEVAALTAADFDLAHGTVTISKQRDRKTNDDKRTKTKRTRVTSIEPELRPLVEAMIAERPRGRLFTPDELPLDEERATTLRRDLKRAGVLRPQLHKEDDPQRLPMWFHHLRDTGLCWMAIRGDDPLRIQWRGGHTDFKTTQRYIAQGRMLADGGAFRAVAPFPPIPHDLFVARLSARAHSDQTMDEAQNVASPTGFENVSEPPIDPFPPGSTGVDRAERGAGRSIAMHSGAPTRRLRRGELHPRDAAHIARETTIALGVRRCQRLAESMAGEKALRAAICDVAELLRGRS